jgi:hypothetical protein
MMQKMRQKTKKKAQTNPKLRNNKPQNERKIKSRSKNLRKER